MISGYETAFGCRVYLVLDLFEKLLVHIDLALDAVLLGDLGRQVGHVGLKLEASEIGDVIKGHLLNIEVELLLGSHAAEWTVTASL